MEEIKINTIQCLTWREQEEIIKETLVRLDLTEKLRKALDEIVAVHGNSHHDDFFVKKLLEKMGHGVK